MNKIITISREFGSGGREIGRRLAEAMKIAYYDQEIVAALIKHTKKAEEYVRYMEKERPLPLLPITTARTFGLSTNYAVAENLNFYMQESKIIDKKRSRYYQFYTNQVWGKKEYYDLCINTSRYAQIKEIIPSLTALVTM